ncbi:MAG: DUF177 domain-containing protein [Oscillospiraceae bacterium]|nr:DUF177 domain-containing protein [Oscillospiraceae bacterium]
MRLNVNKLLHTPGAGQDFHFQLDLRELEFGGMHPISRPVAVDGRVENRAGVLTCSLQASTVLASVCDRCLDAFDEEKTVSYSCVLAEERQSEDNEDIVLLEHDEVDLSELARSAFILGMDTKTLCSPDCKGLCGGCGVNLNREACRCKKQIDPRLAALAKLLDKDGAAD